MFSMDDFNKDESYYQNIEPVEDMGDFVSTLMTITHFLKSIDFDNQMRSGHELMMKIFNMTNLDESQENEEALNVVMALITHLFAILTSYPERDKYFSFFDETVVYPLLEQGKKQ